MDGGLFYRIFSVEPVISRDDGFWRSIAKGNFVGAFAWPGTPDVFAFYQIAGSTRYKITRAASDFVPDGYPDKSIVGLNSWLRAVVGVTLEDYLLDFSEPVVLVNWPEELQRLERYTKR